MRKAMSVIGNVLVAIVVILAMIMTAMVFISTKSEVGLPNIGGKAIFNVLTDSMEGPDGFPEGSLIVIDILDEEGCKDLKVGDVITFWRTQDNMKYIETHRIVENTNDNPSEIVDGIWVHGGVSYYVTKGDNTPYVDYFSDLSAIDYVNSNRIIGKWTGVAIPKLGSVMKFLQSQFGFMICVVAPMAIFFIFELYKFISILMENKRQKAVEAVSEAEDEIKQKAIAEFLAKQEAEKAAAQKAADEDEIKKKAVEEFIAKQEAEKAAAQKAAEEEEIKKKAVEEYLAKQAAEKAAEENKSE